MEKAALPPDVRKASGFPTQTASILPLCLAGRLSLPAEPRDLVRSEALGEAKPFRTSGGRAALGCCLSGTLARPWSKGFGQFEMWTEKGQNTPRQAPLTGI